MTKPYTYLIGWPKEKLWYYGVSYKKGCHPDDLWKSYFTSSKVVKLIRSKFGEPTIVEIRKVFDCIDKAILWESKVLSRLGASDREDFLNLQNGSGIKAPLNNEYINEIRSKASKRYWNDPINRKNQSDRIKNRWKDKKFKEKMSDILIKRYSNNEYKEKFTSIMTDVNKQKKKRDNASKKLKTLWQNDKFRKKTIAPRIGIVWWTNGEKTIKSKTSPGPEWTRGRGKDHKRRKK